MSCFEIEEACNLTDLFYYDLSEKKHANLQKGLREYQFLLCAASLAIQNLKKGNLEKFDSLVGENACQIRAIRTALIASKDLGDFEELNQRISVVLEKVENLLLPSSINRLMRDGHSLKEVIDKSELSIDLTSEQIFIVQSYLLSEMKECSSDGEFISSLCRVEKSMPKKLQILFPYVSYTFINRLASRLRKLLSISSVSFVRKIASGLQDKALVEMVSQNFAIEHNNWSCVPMFWAYKTLLLLTCNEKIPLVLHVKFLSKLENGYRVVDEEFLFFKPCPKTNSYLQVAPTEKDLTKAACIIQGISCLGGNFSNLSKLDWKKTITKHSVVDVILAGAADHRQYPDPNIQIYLHDQEYENYKKMALKKGFSLDNPATFFIQHVYSSQVGQKITALTDANSFIKKAIPLRPAFSF